MTPRRLHATTAARREAELVKARRAIARLTAELAPAPEPDEVDLLAKMRRADPDELESAQCAARVLAARGMPIGSLRALLPAAVAPWATVIESAALDPELHRRIPR